MEIEMEKIRVGIIGAGVISELHLRAYQKINEAEVVALCDINEAVVQSKAKKWAVQKIYTDLNAMLADFEIQAV
jgi:predicted dehydrogenase